MVSPIEAGNSHAPQPEQEQFTAPIHVAIIPDAQETWDIVKIKPVSDAIHRVTTTLGAQGVEIVTVLVPTIEMGRSLELIENYKQYEEADKTPKPYPTVQFRLNGRSELRSAVKTLLRRVEQESVETVTEKDKQAIREKHVAAFDEETLETLLNPNKMPDVDLKIHTGQTNHIPGRENMVILAGDMLLSGSYAELAHTATPFTEITEDEITDILRTQYRAPNRRFGGLPSS